MKPETISHHCDDQGDQGEYAHSTRLATRILFKSFYVRSERSKDLCIHALASMSTLLSAFLHGKSATDLAIGVEDASSLSLRIVDRLSFSYVTVMMTDDELWIDVLIPSPKISEAILCAAKAAVNATIVSVDRKFQKRP